MARKAKAWVSGILHIMLAPAADLYVPEGLEGTEPALAVSGPCGEGQEQCSVLYAQTLAEGGWRLFLPPPLPGERR